MESSGSADASRPDHQTCVATHRHAAATVRHTERTEMAAAQHIARNAIPAGTRYGWAERCRSVLQPPNPADVQAWRDVGPRHAPLRADGDSRGRMRPVLTVDGLMAGALLFAWRWPPSDSTRRRSSNAKANVAASNRKVPTGSLRSATLPWHIAQGLRRRYRAAR